MWLIPARVESLEAILIEPHPSVQGGGVISTWGYFQPRTWRHERPVRRVLAVRQEPAGGQMLNF